MKRKPTICSNHVINKMSTLMSNMVCHISCFLRGISVGMKPTWDRVDALTDGDIEAAASSDLDDPPTDASFWEDATVVMPENMIIRTPRRNI